MEGYEGRPLANPVEDIFDKELPVELAVPVSG